MFKTLVVPRLNFEGKRELLFKKGIFSLKQFKKEMIGTTCTGEKGTTCRHVFTEESQVNVCLTCPKDLKLDDKYAPSAVCGPCRLKSNFCFICMASPTFDSGDDDESNFPERKNVKQADMMTRPRKHKRFPSTPAEMVQICVRKRIVLFLTSFGLTVKPNFK